jgi:hypothetical protein
MEVNAKSAVTPVLSDEDTPASRPGWKTMVMILGMGVVVLALVYAAELKAFLGMQ